MRNTKMMMSAYTLTAQFPLVVTMSYDCGTFVDIKKLI